MDVPVHYDEISLRLMNVLDTVGLREKARWKRIEMWTQTDELLTLCVENATIQTFGSQAEATTTLGLNSDTDMVHRDHNITILNDLQSWEPDSVTYFMILDYTTPPGYVKLQRVYTNVPLLACNLETDRLRLDRYGRSCLHNDDIYFKMDACEHHGPANTISMLTAPRVSKSVDIVFALRALSWPHIASEWITRNREHNWPTQEIISTIVQSGTLLVPVGHKLSTERHLEWRISLSYGEKILVWQFNSTQYKCYVLLKMINKYFIKPIIGENVLTSYHWKTCVFYMIEATPIFLWQPQNLLHCIELCLMKMCTWVEEYNCPNYFIPAENMFLGKLYGPIQRDLATILHYLLRQKGRYLTVIPYDGIGQKLCIVCQSPITQIDDEKNDSRLSLASAVKNTLFWIFQTWFFNLRDGVQINSRLLKIPLSSNAARQEIGTILQKFYCSNLGSYLASKCMKHQAIDLDGLDMAHEFLLYGSSSDVASGKLKLAAFHLLQNNLIYAENILHNIEENYTFLVSDIHTGFTRQNNKQGSVSFVSNFRVTLTKQPLLLKIENENLSTTDVVRYYSAFPVPYLPSEMYCTPRALVPEMFCLTGSQESSLDPKLDYGQSWTVVDPKLYLHFLLHQCYHRQNKIRHQMIALGNMIWVIRHESLLYKVTALNVLAYCLKEDGFLVQSYTVLSKSMKLKNHHNAAKWKIACLINDAFRWLGSRR